MTTKLETLKQAVGYSDKPVLPTCSNCSRFSSERLLPAWIQREIKVSGYASLWPQGQCGYRKFEKIEEVPPEFRVEKNMRCSKHGFAVKKLGRCDDHERKQF